MMKNKEYSLYEIPYIKDMKDLLLLKKKETPASIAFRYREKEDHEIIKIYEDFYNEICAMGTWMFSNEIRNKHVAIVGENSYEWIVCFFSIVNGGNVAVPIDKELPAREIAKLLDKADVDCVFYSESYKTTVENALDLLGRENLIGNYDLAGLDGYLAIGNRLISNGQKDYERHSVDSKKLCCIMFTSGTSGDSKGVMLSHENIAEDINGSCQLFFLEGPTLSVLPFHHAFGLFVGVFMPFHYGKTVFLNKNLKRVKPDLLSATPQTMFLVPLFVETFYKQIWATAKKEGKEKLLRKMMMISEALLKIGIDIRRKAFSSIHQVFGGNLEYIICGGAPLMPFYVKEFRRWGIEILNGYGTTECAPVVAVNRNNHHKDGTVGLSLPNVQVKINDEGEVLVKGTIVMMGYYKDNKNTQDAMYVDDNDVETWYATGDLGEIDSDGFISLTGRKKNLIILSNGENISPEELEADYLEDKAVQEVLVYEVEGQIVAEIFPDQEIVKTWEGENTDMFAGYFENLRKTINKNRPLYKQVSKVYLRQKEFPKNTSKKIIRKGKSHVE